MSACMQTLRAAAPGQPNPILHSFWHRPRSFAVQPAPIRGQTTITHTKEGVPQQGHYRSWFHQTRFKSFICCPRFKSFICCPRFKSFNCCPRARLGLLEPPAFKTCLPSASIVGALSLKAGLPVVGAGWAEARQVAAERRGWWWVTPG